MLGRTPARTETLRCQHCGNEGHFLETISFQINIVDRYMTHIHMIESEADHYSCTECGALVEPKVVDPQA